MGRGPPSARGRKRRAQHTADDGDVDLWEIKQILRGINDVFSSLSSLKMTQTDPGGGSVVPPQHPKEHPAPPRTPPGHPRPPQHPPGSSQEPPQHPLRPPPPNLPQHPKEASLPPGQSQYPPGPPQLSSPWGSAFLKALPASTKLVAASCLLCSCRWSCAAWQKAFPAAGGGRRGGRGGGGSKSVGFPFFGVTVLGIHRAPTWTCPNPM